MPPYALNSLWKHFVEMIWNNTMKCIFLYIYIHTLNDRSLLEFDDPLIRFQDLDEATREALHEAARSFAVDAMLGPASLVFPFFVSNEWDSWDIAIFRGQKTENFVGFLRPETLAAAVVGLGAPGSLGGLSGLSAHLLDDMRNKGFDMRVESEWATVGWWLAVPQECKASGVEGSWLRCECILRRWIRRDLEATCSWVRVFATHWTCKRYTYDSWQYGLCSVEWLLRMAFSKGSKLFPIAACLDVTSHVDLEWCYDHVSIMSLLQGKVSTHLVAAFRLAVGLLSVDFWFAHCISFSKTNSWQAEIREILLKDCHLKSTKWTQLQVIIYKDTCNKSSTFFWIYLVIGP